MKTTSYVCNVGGSGDAALTAPSLDFAPRSPAENKTPVLPPDPAFGAGPDEEPLIVPGLNFEKRKP